MRGKQNKPKANDTTTVKKGETYQRRPHTRDWGALVRNEKRNELKFCLGHLCENTEENILLKKPVSIHTSPHTHKIQKTLKSFAMVWLLHLLVLPHGHAWQTETWQELIRTWPTSNRYLTLRHATATTPNTYLTNTNTRQHQHLTSI